MKDAILFNIQRFSTHDGPGIRTTVFFKGCPLKCRWCHNPESQLFIPEIMLNAERCTLCGRCAMVCPAEAVSVSDGKIKTDRLKCTGCRTCTEECLNCARELAGEEYSADKIMDVICRDKTFYSESGGGATFSGGECLAQIEPLTELLKRCRRMGIHTAVDTCGFCEWKDMEATVPYTNLYLYDIKCLDTEKHRQLTGESNEKILQNLRRLKAAGAEIWLRMPLIEGLNADDGDILPAVELAKEIHPSRVSLLPYHSAGSFKYARLGRVGEEFAAPSAQRLDEIKTIFEDAGLSVKIGG